MMIMESDTETIRMLIVFPEEKQFQLILMIFG